MDNDTIIYIVWGACLIGILLWSCLVYLRRRLREAIAVDGPVQRIFSRQTTADELGQRVREIASHFTGSPEFYAHCYCSLSKRY